MSKQLDRHRREWRLADAKGFTLIEMLVVIAIIALLAAILFPVFGRARANARRSSCQSNMKQISLGVLQYVQDYDERFPKTGGSTNGIAANCGGPDILSWASKTQPYIKSTQVFVCPEDTRKIANMCSYGNNQLIGVLAPTDAGIAVSTIAAPSHALLWYEDGYLPAYNTIGCNNYWDRFAFSMIQRHLEGSNIAFVDGHVKWYVVSLNSSQTQKSITWQPGTTPP